ncbi:DUF5642 family protein [Mycobacterium parmense]|uniref:DUF5642 family protein n=1 Tax=Mycobacterium parmense TaxID=185642 RepID=UPI000A1619AE|nr:DUF5642 family protein [Mycobacterium parmense]MCV7352080.1 DUF5642 family protein [Mycobacterium parmense]ORW56397.1 hypothetical protein AWC20_15230 [Mycobacterium parmense]
MRPCRIGRAATPVLALLILACSHPRPPAATPATTKSPTSNTAAVNPANIRRVMREMPPGYEVTAGSSGESSPRLIWTLKVDATAQPAQCMEFADPGSGRAQSAQSVSGSGSGGILDVVVVALPERVDVDDDLVAACRQWSMSAGHATANVRLTDAPHVEGAKTLGMVVDVRSTVESGSEIDTRAYTYTAYLGDYYVFSTLTTDPGSALPALSPQFAADLLVKTVSTLRG